MSIAPSESTAPQRPVALDQRIVERRLPCAVTIGNIDCGMVLCARHRFQIRVKRIGQFYQLTMIDIR